MRSGTCAQPYAQRHSLCPRKPVVQFWGFLIVVEDGARHIDQEVAIVVTRGLQTAAGRMIFATLKGQNGRGPYIGPRGR